MNFCSLVPTNEEELFPPDKHNLNLSSRTFKKGITYSFYFSVIIPKIIVLLYRACSSNVVIIVESLPYHKVCTIGDSQTEQGLNYLPDIIRRIIILPQLVLKIDETNNDNKCKASIIIYCFEYTII